MTHSIYAPDANADHGTASANRLHRCYAEIIERWEAVSRARLPAAAMKSHEDLVDSLPYFLHGLIEALSVNGEDIETGEAAHVFRKHAEQRARLEGYTLSQLLGEYSILRETLFEVLERESPLTTREQQIVNRAIDFGLKECCSEFHQIELARFKNRLHWASIEHDQDRHVLHSIQDALLSFDFESRFTFINEAAAKLLGKSPAELLTKHAWDVFQQELNQQFFQICTIARLERKPAALLLCDESGCMKYEARAYPSRDGFSVLIIETAVNEPLLTGEPNERAPWLHAEVGHH